MAPVLAGDAIKRLSVERTSLVTIGWSPPTSPTSSPKAKTVTPPAAGTPLGFGTATTQTTTQSPRTANGSMSPTSASPEVKHASEPTSETSSPRGARSKPLHLHDRPQSPAEHVEHSEHHMPNVPTRKSLKKVLQKSMKLIEVPENPMSPQSLDLWKRTARDRSSELQDIFTSRCSEVSDRLRSRLQSLTIQAAELRGRISSLERELHEVNAQRLKDAHQRSVDEEQHETGPPVVISVKRDNLEMPPARLGEDDDLPMSATPSGNQNRKTVPRQKPAELLLSPDHDEVVEVREDPSHIAELDAEVAHVETEQVRPDLLTLPASGQAWANFPQADDLSRRGSESRYHEEVLVQVLHRRRAEARFREVSSVHENSIQQMEAEQKEIERRMQKQQNWMKNIDEQVLKAEITKTKYHIRLQSANRRVKSMGEELSRAYENMAALLEERLEVEDQATQNEALVAYLSIMGKADAKNDAEFVENKEELLSLLHTSQQAQRMRSYMEELMDQTRRTQSLVLDVVKHSDDLQRLADALQQLWNIIPVDWKDAVFKSVQKGLSAPLAMHPVNAIQALQSASASIHASQKSYNRALSEFLPRDD